MAQKSLLVGVNRPVDFKNLTDLEKKHLPVLEAPETVAPGEYFELIVEVGKLLAHPNEYNHFIQFLDVYADRTYWRGLISRLYRPVRKRRSAWPWRRRPRSCAPMPTATCMERGSASGPSRLPDSGRIGPTKRPVDPESPLGPGR